MWLAEGVMIPGYSGIIFRRYIEDLTEGSSSILAKTMKLYPALGGKIAGLEWRFPSGATIEMSGIAHDNKVMSVQGKAFHRVAFDELTHFTEAMYNFVVYNRIRKLKNFPIWCGARASANPGGPGHEWVKNKFISDDAIRIVREIDINTPTPMGMMFFGNKEDEDGMIVEDKDTVYVPSRAADNPSLDIQDYFNRQLKNKNPVERARMMNGDWGMSPEGLIKPHWLRYYTLRGAKDNPMVQLLESVPDNRGGVNHTDKPFIEIVNTEFTRFFTVDTAGGSKDITAASKGKNPSWTVCAVWDYKRLSTENQALILRYVWRDRVGFTDVADKLLELSELWKPSRVKVENATMGPHLVSLLAGKIPISTIPIKSDASTRGNDKVSRAAPFLNMLERGEVYLPKHENTWRKVYETELLGWQGLDEETNDQIDVSSYAALEIGGFSGGQVILDHDPRRQYIEERKSRVSGWY